ncbi:MAG: M18 family aminopeptidase [Bacteroidales bacterium]|nr:M18 family aminopeptidase [Bacteroidales bacterium]
MIDNEIIESLRFFMDGSPVNFWAVRSAARQLEYAGFTRLEMTDDWHLTPGGRHYVVQNDSAIFAFIVGEDIANQGFNIIAAHSDSPGFRIKPRCEMRGEGGSLRLNTEVYGGPILYTWFDRPLSVAGRVILRSDNPLRPRHELFDAEQPLLVIPHLAIHFNRNVNDGNKLSKQKDMIPVAGIGLDSDFSLRSFVAGKMDVSPDDIIDYDLSLYDCQGFATLGLEESLMNCGRLDDLSMVHAALLSITAMCDTPSRKTRVMAIFDNEETGSGTKQGAASPILEYILRRICLCSGLTDQQFMRAVANSFMISADNAHGLHPNYVEKQDPTNHPVLGGGPVVKINANCKYMTDADSAAVFKTICEMAEVPCQEFVNHSDVAGGSTLGNILTSQLPLRGVDMGAPLWAMHSCRETASTSDHVYITDAFCEFFSL